jgi:hypothetical protein
LAYSVERLAAKSVRRWHPTAIWSLIIPASRRGCAREPHQTASIGIIIVVCCHRFAIRRRFCGVAANSNSSRASRRSFVPADCVVDPQRHAVHWLDDEARVNHTFEPPFMNGADTEMRNAWQYLQRLGEKFEPGLEGYRSLGGRDGVGAFNDYEQQLGPAAFGKLRWTRGALKYEAGLRFGLNEPLSQPLYVA